MFKKTFLLILICLNLNAAQQKEEKKTREFNNIFALDFRQIANRSALEKGLKITDKAGKLFLSLDRFDRLVFMPAEFCNEFLFQSNFVTSCFDSADKILGINFCQDLDGSLDFFYGKNVNQSTLKVQNGYKCVFLGVYLGACYHFFYHEVKLTEQDFPKF